MVSTNTGDQLVALEENWPWDELVRSSTQAVLKTLLSFPLVSCDCRVICSEIFAGSIVCTGDTNTNFCTSAKSTAAPKIVVPIPKENEKIRYV